MRRVRTEPPAPAGTTLPWGAALLALAVVIAYANGLSGPFILDDQAAIVQNASIRDLGRLEAVLAPAPDSPVAGRPLVNLTFALNYAAGGLDVRGYHLFSVGLHLLCVLLAFAFIRFTLELPSVRARLTMQPPDLAFAAVLLWAVHPLNSEVVDYLSQRTESMMALCYLATVTAAAWSTSSRRPVAWQITAVVACLLGTLSKESMATAPLVVLLYDRVFLFGSWREACGQRWRLYAGLALSWAVLAAVLMSNPRGDVAGFSSGVPVWTYLLNQAEVVVEYLRLTVWPHALVAFYGWPQPLVLADVWPQALLIGVLLVATAVALVRVPPLGFAGAWFFVTLAPASSIVPVATEVGAERRMYLPLLGLIVLVVIGVAVLLERASRRRGDARPSLAMRVGAGLLCAVTLALAAMTVLRNREYADALRLMETIVERRPTAVAHHMLGEHLAQADRLPEAESHLRQAVAGGNSRANYLLGLVLFNQTRIQESIGPLEAFLRTVGVTQVPRWLEPPGDEVLRARVALATALVHQRQWERAAEQASAALAVAPRFVEARGVLAQARYGQERWADSIREYGEYLASRPNDVSALMNYGVSLVASDRLPEALPVFRRAVSIDPRNPNARRLLQMAEQDSRP